MRFVCHLTTSLACSAQQAGFDCGPGDGGHIFAVLRHADTDSRPDQIPEVVGAVAFARTPIALDPFLIGSTLACNALHRRRLVSPPRDVAGRG